MTKTKSTDMVRVPYMGPCIKCGKRFNHAPEGTNKIYHECSECRGLDKKDKGN